MRENKEVYKIVLNENQESRFLEISTQTLLQIYAPFLKDFQPAYSLHKQTIISKLSKKLKSSFLL